MTAQEHVVKQGETLASISRQYGHLDWRAVYMADENADLRCRRPDPNLIYPGDLVYIPAKDAKFLAAESDQRHVFRAHLDAQRVKLRMVDHLDDPLKNVSYELELDGTIARNTTDGDGMLEFDVPLDTETADLTLRLQEGDPEAAYTWHLEIGHLDPANEISGIQARLHNLAFPCGPIDGKRGPLTDKALCSFQLKHDIKDQDPCSEETIAAMEKTHGC